MKVDVSAGEGCTRRLAVEAPAEVVAAAWERASSAVQRRAHLPGFRKGHVPRALVRQRFADDVRREVVEHLIPEVFRQAVAEAQLEPVDEPRVEDVALAEGAPLSFVATVEVKPVIELGEYRGLAVAHAPVPVAAADVEQALERLREQHGELRSVERPAAVGDAVIVDYQVALEGAEPAGQSGYLFFLGDGTVLPEIDAAVVGARAGEERDVALAFPDDHRREDLRGRTGSARVRVTEVKEKALPPLDDDFARAVGAFESLAGLRAAALAELEARRASDERHALEDKLVTAALERHEFAVPDALVQRQIAHQVGHLREGVRRQGVDPDQVGWDYAKLIEELRPAATRAVRRTLLLEAVAAREGLAPSEADLDAEIERLAAPSGRPAAAVRRMMERNGDVEALAHALRERLALDVLVRHAELQA